ncbi:MAG: SNF2-related protein [Candidatus Obscuribacterales bacterium]
MSSRTRTPLTAYFDWSTLRSGKDYFDRGNVLDFSLDEDGDIEGRVSGSGGREYETLLLMDWNGGAVKGTDCSCPLGRDCKHAAALLLAYLDQTRNRGSAGRAPRARRVETPGNAVAGGKQTGGERVKSVSLVPELEPDAAPPAPGKRMVAPRPDLLRPEVRFSLNYLRDLKGQKADGHSPGRRASTRTSSIVYLLSPMQTDCSPSIGICSVSILKDGSYGAMRSQTADRILDGKTACATEEDIEVARLYIMAALGGSGGYYYFNDRIRRDVDRDLFGLLMQRVLATGRCYYRDIHGRPLSAGRELSGRLSWQGAGQSGRWSPGIIALDGDDSYPCLPWTVPWYVDETRSVCGPVSIDLSREILFSVLRMPSLTEEEGRALPAVMHDMGLLDLLPAPPCAGPVLRKKIPPVPVLDVANLKAVVTLDRDGKSILRSGENTRAAVVSAHFPGKPEKPYMDEEGTLVLEEHDPESLTGFRERLESLGLVEVSPQSLGLAESGDCVFVADDLSVWAGFDENVVEALREEGWQISGKTEEKLAPVEVDADDLWFEASEEKSWWFSLGLNIRIGGKMVPLMPILISAIRGMAASESIGDSIDVLDRDGKFYATLDDGRILSIPFERIRSMLAVVKELIEKDLDPDRLSLVDAVEIFDDETLDRKNWIGLDRISKMVERLRALQSIPEAKPPVGLKTELRPYQLEGLSWLQFLAEHNFGGILADDMGLGKTVQLLAHILSEKEEGRLKEPYLVVCPTTVLPNWQAEIARFAPQLQVVTFHGPDRYGRVSAMKKADIVLTTYPLLSRDSDSIQRIKYHGVVLDEAQAIKNHNTAMARAARGLKAGHRFCLTGTPVENHLGELWSQFQFLLPGLLGDHHEFKDVFRDPIEKFGDSRARKNLTTRIKPFLVRRTKQEVAADLPEKSVIVQHVDLEGPQRDLYETVRLSATKKVRDEIKKKGFKHSQIMILDALLKLRQACCHPGLVKLEAASGLKASAKLTVLLDMLRQLAQEGRKILVFSQFTSMLDIISGALHRAGLDFVTIRGDTRDRATPVKQFQEGKVPIFLLSLKAGGTGLNLTAADTVIHYDPWWNPAAEAQATDRAHRIGQTRSVFVYKLIARGTIEERMLALQQDKLLIASSIYDDGGNLGRGFSEADLEHLLSPICQD